nr:hypothetical protein [Candidatus Microthrix sp.]
MTPNPWAAGSAITGTVSSLTANGAVTSAPKYSTSAPMSPISVAPGNAANARSAARPIPDESMPPTYASKLWE